MAYVQELRIGIGSPTGLRSTVWKFNVHNNDIYVVSGMFEKNCKISLHESGECQYSGTSKWVLADHVRRNRDRHFQKWKLPRPIGNTAIHVLQILIPDIELRNDESIDDFSNVTWLAAPPVGTTAVLDMYITRPLDADPIQGANFQHSFLFSMQLADLRWFVAFYHGVSNDNSMLAELHSQLRTEAISRRTPLLPTYRMSALGNVIDTGAFMYIELAPNAEDILLTANHK